MKNEMTNPFAECGSQLIFISHASKEDHDIAMAFEKWIKLAYRTNVSTFVSSTVGIPPNTPPAQAIAENLKKTTILIALLSPVAHDHDWLTSEISEIRGRQKTVLPILCKNATANKIPKSILTMHELLDASNIDQFFSVIQTLDKKLSMIHCNEYETLRHTLCGNNKETRPPNNEMANKFQLIQGTNIKVDSKNKAPLCPTCLEKGKTNYLYTSKHTTFDGERGTYFKCNSYECDFCHTLLHDKPWQEMLVDL